MYKKDWKSIHKYYPKSYTPVPGLNEIKMVGDLCNPPRILT